MHIQAKKLSLIEWLIKLKDEAVINKIDSFRNKVNTYDPTKKISIEELYADLEASENDRKSGRVTSIEDLEKESDKW